MDRSGGAARRTPGQHMDRGMTRKACLGPSEIATSTDSDPGEWRQTKRGEPANGQSHRPFGERDLLPRSEGIFGRRTRRRQQRQFDGLLGLSWRRDQRGSRRRGAAGDAGHSRGSRGGARANDARGYRAGRLGSRRSDGRAQVLERQYGISVRRLLRPRCLGAAGTFHQRRRRAGIVLSHGRGL